MMTVVITGLMIIQVVIMTLMMQLPLILEIIEI